MGSTLSINTNLASLGAQRQLGSASASLGRSFERLSSGLRINRAADDAAGLSIGSLLNADSRVFNQAVRNVNDAVSAYNVSQGAISQLSSILTRITELGTQSANGVLSPTQRLPLDAESQALRNEFNRIVSTTQLNNLPLLSDPASFLNVQAGYSSVTLPMAQLQLGGQGDATFDAPTAYGSAGTLANGLVGMDFDMNGTIDVAINDQAGSAVRLFLSNADGTLLAPSVLGGANSAASIAAGDIDGDGDADIVTSSYLAAVRIFKANGNGTFLAPVSVGNFSGVSFRALNIGDVNGDGSADIVVGGYQSQRMLVYLGTGSGSFGSPLTAVLGNRPQTARLADLNGDSRLDIVVSTNVDVEILLANGDGTFQAAITSYTASSPLGLQTLDFDNDGLIDIVSGGINALRFQHGNGNGTFRAPVSFATFTSVDSLSAGDMNGDGSPDIIATSVTTPAVRVYLSNADGTFLAGTSYATPVTPRASMAKDLNGDGILDLSVVSDAPGPASLNVFVGNGVATAILPAFSLRTKLDSLYALNMLDSALTQVNLAQGQLGGSQSRLDTAARVLTRGGDDSLQAASRIIDVDVAEEAASLVSFQIKQQSASAILAQANLQPELALRLLQSL